MYPLAASLATLTTCRFFLGSAKRETRGQKSKRPRRQKTNPYTNCELLMLQLQLQLATHNVQRAATQLKRFSDFKTGSNINHTKGSESNPMPKSAMVACLMTQVIATALRVTQLGDCGQPEA